MIQVSSRKLMGLRAPSIMVYCHNGNACPLFNAASVSYAAQRARIAMRELAFDMVALKLSKLA